MSPQYCSAGFPLTQPIRTGLWVELDISNFQINNRTYGYCVHTSHAGNTKALPFFKTELLFFWQPSTYKKKVYHRKKSYTACLYVTKDLGPTEKGALQRVIKSPIFWNTHILHNINFIAGNATRRTHLSHYGIETKTILN